MPAGRPVKNLEPHKEALVGLFREGTTYEDLKEWLSDQGVNVSVRTIKSTFKRWNVGRRLRTDVAEAVKLKIRYYFLDEHADDSTILQSLEKDGYFIGKWTLVRLRFELGLKRRIQGVEAQARADTLVQEKEKEIEKKPFIKKADSSNEFPGKARKRGISETTSPQQERSPRTRNIPEHIGRDEDVEDSAPISNTSLHKSAEVKRSEVSKVPSEGISNQPQSPTPEPSTQARVTILPAPYGLRSKNVNR